VLIGEVFTVQPKKKLFHLNWISYSLTVLTEVSYKKHNINMLRVKTAES